MAKKWLSGFKKRDRKLEAGSWKLDEGGGCQLPATSFQFLASSNQLPAASNQLPVSGRAWVYGDNVNTDVIFPGKYTYTISDPAEMARRVTVNAMQVLGGAGYMKDFPAEKYVRDAMVLPIISGANEVLKYFMSKKL